jgi:hypothetical protein
MKKFSQKLANTFTAVAFAEQGEWDDAEKFATGSFEAQAADGKQIRAVKEEEKRITDHRPRLRVEATHYCRPKPPTDLR